MPDLELLSPTRVRGLLAQYGLRPSKALGQNFLADPNTARRIVRLANVQPGDHVLEIGPGIGSLTLALLNAGAHVTALELDRHLLPLLDEVVGDGHVRVVHGDAMDVDLAPLVEGDERWSVVANLPYNVATPVVMRVLEELPTVGNLLVMVQREVGERLAATVGTKVYGGVTVKVAYYGAAEVVGLVPATVFVPAPRVESALVRIVRHERPPVDVPSEQALFTLVRAGFAQRRKMLRQSLRAVLRDDAEAVLVAAGVDPRARAETLDLEMWARLARAAAGQ